MRGPQTHLVILDGTMSTLVSGQETNAGLTYRLAQQMGREISIYYEPGVQWSDWRSVGDVIVGRGINRQIRRAYGYLASRYRAGDKIFLVGYSRGAYAVRSLAGVIDRVGLLHRDHATERNIRQVYRLYKTDGDNDTAKTFAKVYCRAEAPIEMIGVWDTVKSLGLNAPVLWRLSARHHAFHNHALGAGVKRGVQALALGETRVAYRPVLWAHDPDNPSRVSQVWFRGNHGDIGGQLGRRLGSRPLSNIPLAWMLGQLQDAGLPLPQGWRDDLALDVHAPSTGVWAGWGKLFWNRRKRIVCGDPSESLHASITPPNPPDVAIEVEQPAVEQPTIKRSAV